MMNQANDRYERIKKCLTMLTQSGRLETVVAGASIFDPRLRRHSRGRVADMFAARPMVVVGIDGLPGALKAVTWATVEAERRGVPLKLVYAADPATCAGAIDTVWQEVGHASMEVAIAQARSVSGSVEVVCDIVHASPAVALARSRAVLICLGSNGSHSPRPGHRVGLATEVLLAADCPVTVVRGAPLAEGWVVAQLAEDPNATDVLRIAAEESVAHRMPLRLLTNWRAGAAPRGVDFAELDRRLQRDLVRWVNRHPGLDVAVERNVALEQYLRDHGDRIALFVAAERQSHDVGTVLHPDAELALRMLHCPVMLCVRSTNASSTSRSTEGLHLPKLRLPAFPIPRSIRGRWRRRGKGALR
jgi:nucleotide-binding universal stress UspA family protein